MNTPQFYVDFSDLASWIAAADLHRAQQETGCAVSWRAVPPLLSPEMVQRGDPAWSQVRWERLDEQRRRRAEALGLSGEPPAEGEATRRARALLNTAPEAERPELTLQLFEALALGKTPPEPSDPTETAPPTEVFALPALIDGARALCGEAGLRLAVATLGGRSYVPSPPVAPTGEVIEVFHDIASPFAYLAVEVLPALAAARGLMIHWRPILLGALFRAIGNPLIPVFAMPPGQQASMFTGLTEWAAFWGVPFTFPACFPVRSVLPMRVSLVAPEANAPLYRALWTRGEDVGQAEGVAEVLRAEGLDAEAILRAAEAQEVKDTLRRNTEEAQARGVCGVPTLIRADGARWWGQDLLREALR
jgi:2-hydroxychromene-2-carboxylate isomerase